MNAKRGIQQRLVRAFLVQGLLISITAVIGVYAAGTMIREVLVTRALQEEADFFWDRRMQDPAFALPDTLNLTGYLASGDSSAPEYLVSYEPGYHDLPSEADFTTLYVTVRNGEKLYLLFDGEQVGRLALYFGLLPLMMVLVALYLAAWMAWRLAGRAISPLIWLAHEVDRFDPDPKANNLINADKIPTGVDREVLALATALNNLNLRITDFVEREHQFTRDASHELRSPLTVIKIAADMLLSEQELSDQARNSVERILRNAGDMEELMEALLLLARESDLGLSIDEVCVNDVLDEEVERVRQAIGDKPVIFEIKHDCRLYVQASAKALTMLLGNLLRNAANYTDQGSIMVTLNNSGVTIEDSGVGMTEEQLGKVFTPYYRAPGATRAGHGVGLSIVKRLSDRFDWPLEMNSEPGAGTSVQVFFPSGKCSEEQAA